MTQDRSGGGGRVVALFRKAARHQPSEALERAEAVANLGIAGDAFAKAGGKRQVLLIDAETLDELGLAPGVLSENVTTRGLELQSLPLGSRLHAGDALFELTVACPPCADLNEIRPGLQREVVGRRGVLARVVEGGEIRVGDPVEVSTPG